MLTNRPLHFFRSLKTEGVVQNAFFSLLNKGINAIVPLLFIPLCSNLFGLESFGKMVYFQALVGLVITFADYGFSVTGLKNAALHSNNPSAINKLFNEISFIKLILLLSGGGVLYCYLSFASVKLHSIGDILLFLFVFISLSLQSLLPYWLYQGLKNNKVIAVINFFSKLFLLLATALLVINSKDIFTVPLVEMLSYLLALLASLFLLKRKYQLSFQMPTVNGIKKQAAEGFNFFLIVLIYWAINGGSILFVERKVSLFELGFYSIFLRFSYYTFTVFQPVILSMIPYFTDKFSISFVAGVQYFKKIFIYYFLSVLLVVGTICFCLHPILSMAFNKEIVDFFNGHKIIPFAFFVWTFLLLVNNFTANAILLSSHKENVFRNAQILNGATVVLFFFILIPRFGSLGACLSMVLGELIFLVAIFSNSYKYLFIKLNQQDGKIE